MRNGVYNASREATETKAVGDGPGAAWGELGGFDNGGVACGDGIGNRADAKDIGCVPRVS